MFSLFFSFSLCDLPYTDCLWIPETNMSLAGYKIIANTPYCFNGSYYIQGQQLSIKGSFWDQNTQTFTNEKQHDKAKGLLGQSGSQHQPIGQLTSTVNQTIYAFAIEPPSEETVTVNGLSVKVTKDSVIGTSKSSSITSSLKISLKSNEGGDATFTKFKLANTEKASISLTASSDLPMKVKTAESDRVIQKDENIQSLFIEFEPDYQEYIQKTTPSGSFQISRSMSSEMEFSTQGSLAEFIYKLPSGNCVLSDENLEEYSRSSMKWILTLVIVIVVLVIVVSCVVCFCCFCKKPKYDDISVNSQLL